jgi:acetyl-CoA C-acetyltransferase
MLDAYIYDGLRTPIGRHAGKLAPGAARRPRRGVIREVDRAKQEIEATGDQRRELLGLASTQAARTAGNVAALRRLLRRGAADHTPGGDGEPPVRERPARPWSTRREPVTCGEERSLPRADVESMSRRVLRHEQVRFALQPRREDVRHHHRLALPEPKVVKQYGNHSMPETGDNVAKDFGITREQADEFALASQQKYAKAEARASTRARSTPYAFPREKGTPSR